MNSPESEQSRWFADEVQPHEPALRAYLCDRFPKLAGQVDDLVQEAYVRIIRARDGGKVAEPRAYLFVIARNAALDLFRRNRFISIDGLGENDRLRVVEDKPDAAETASQKQEIEILTAAVQALPERCREVFTLQRFQGLSYREIAQRLGISEATVSAQLAIAMLRCRDYLWAHGVLSPRRDAAKSSRPSS